MELEYKIRHCQASSRLSYPKCVQTRLHCFLTWSLTLAKEQGEIREKHKRNTSVWE